LFQSLYQAGHKNSVETEVALSACTQPAQQRKRSRKEEERIVPLAFTQRDVIPAFKTASPPPPRHFSTADMLELTTAMHHTQQPAYQAPAMACITILSMLYPSHPLSDQPVANAGKLKPP
jgi:hypothetical protein